MRYARAIGFSLLLVLILGAWAPLSARTLKLYQYYDDNGILRVRYTYYVTAAGEVRQGTATTWYDDGRIREVYEYTDGRKNGTYTWWGYGEDGKQFIQESGDYVNDIKEGEWYGTSPYNGEIRFIDEYDNDQVISRKLWEFSGDGTLSSMATQELKYGEWSYRWTGYYTNGNKAYELSKEAGAELWSCTSFYGYLDEPTGLLEQGMLTEGSYMRGYDSYKQGLWVKNYSSGGIYRLTEYSGGVKHGLEVVYDANGRVETETEYSYGAKHGKEKTYVNGALISFYNYVDDIRDGEQRDFLSNGPLSMRCTFQNGELQGKYEQWWANGNLSGVIYYAGGRKEGLGLTYFENGTLRSQYTYKDDQLNGPFTLYYESGAIEFQGTCLNGSYEGLLTKYWEGGEGAIESTVTFKNGIREGETTYYMYLSSYVQQQGSFCNGSMCGTWLNGRLEAIYDEHGDTVGWKYVTDTVEYTPVTYNTTNPTPYPEVQGNKEIRGRAKRSDTGKPISGVRVQIGGDSTSTDGTGYYSIQIAPLDAYDVSFSKNGYSGHRESVDMKDKSYRTVNALLAPQSALLPAVTKVESQYGSIFLQSIPITNAYTAAINWGGTAPGTVHFRVNGTDNPVPGGADGAIKTFNMGSDFLAGFNPKGNYIRVTAENMNGTSPSILTLNPIVLPIPSWSASLGLFTFELKNGVAAYGLQKQWPEEPLAIQINQKSLGDTLWAAWGLFPLIGGKEFGIPPTQVSLGVQVKTDGSGAVAAGGKTGFAVAGSTIEGTLKGTGDVKYLPDEGLAWTGASVETGLKGIIKREVGPVQLIPALAGATELGWGVGRMFQWFNNTAKIEGAINVATDLKLGVGNNNGAISFNPAEGVVQSGIDLGMSSELMGFKANLSGGGAAKLFWQVPANPSYFKSAEVELSAKLEVAWKSFKNTFEGAHTLLGGTRAPTALAGPSKSGTGFQPISRDFLNFGPYNSFLAPPLRTGRSPLLVRETQAATDSAIVTNIYPYAEPAVTGDGNKMAIAYVYNNPNVPELVRATDIYATYFNGTQFSTPAPILSDTRAEFAPTLAFDRNGKVLCAWERVKNEAFTGTGNGITDMAAMAAEMEIAYAVYDPATGAWSTPSALTDNDYLDFKPMLQRGADGSLLLVWQSNSGNLTTGSDASPTRIQSALWDADARQFGTPVQSSEGFVNAFDFSLAYKGPNAVLAFAKDGDGDFSTTTDQEIRTASFEGTTWTSSSAVSSDTLQDTNPRIVYSATGNPDLVWRKGDTLVHLMDWNTKDYETIRTGCQSLTFSDFRLFRDPQNRLALIWQDIAAEKIDLFYLVYDPAKSSWSKDLRLTNDAPLEKDFQGFFDPEGKLHLAYVKEDRGTGINDLHYLTYQLKADLTVSGQNMATDPPNPAPGSAVTLSCRVDNVGDTPFSDVAVDFYLGDPKSGGQLIGRGVVSPSELKAGASGSASLTWDVPANLNSSAVYAVVDPDNSAPEANENNNTAVFFPLLPDLIALQCRPQDLGDGSVDVTAVVKNSGAVPATGVEVLYKVNGAAIGVISLPLLKAGETAEISRLLWAGSDFSGEQPEIEVVVDPSGKIAESNKDNNRAFAPLMMDPNFIAGPAEITFEREAPGSESAPEMILITNTGGKDLHVTNIVLSDTTNFSLNVGGGHTPLGGTTAAIPGGGSRTVTVSFKPSGAGTFSANLTITTDDPDTPERVIRLGVKEAPPAPRPIVSITPVNHDFGNIEINGIAAPFVFLVTNAGDADLTVSAINLSDSDHFNLDLGAGDNPINSLPAVIPAGASRTVGVAFSAWAVGLYKANMTISSNDPDHPDASVAVQGNVMDEPHPTLRLSPSAFFFGSVATGGSSAPFSFSIANTGGAPLPIDRVTLTDSTNFSLDLNGGSNPLGSLPALIPAGENRTITATFNPSADMGFSAFLVIGSSDRTVAPARAILSGNHLLVPGDVNGDGSITLADAILVLQITSRVTPTGQTIANTADVNNDGMIGMAEAIYILQTMAGIRED